jgi:hypothetical protein
MDPRPDDIRTQIEGTRAELDRDLDRLGARIDRTKERMKLQAQWWGGISAIAAGALGMVMFWPRRVVRRRVAQPFRGAIV